MDLLTPALSFITKAFTENKRVKEFSNDFISGFINWIEPYFIEKDAKLAEALNESPEEESTQTRLEIRLEEMLKDDDFKKGLENYLKNPQAQIIQRKNIIDGTIGDIDGNAKIGDKTTNDQENFDEKNIISGKMGNIKGDFEVGDG